MTLMIIFVDINLHVVDCYINVVLIQLNVFFRINSILF